MSDRSVYTEKCETLPQRDLAGLRLQLPLVIIGAGIGPLRRPLVALRPQIRSASSRAGKTRKDQCLASEAVDSVMKERLQAVLVTLDPLKLLDEIRTMQQHIAGLASGEPVHVVPHRDADLDRFLKSLAYAWRDGEVRPTHRSGPQAPRHWRTRQDPFGTAWPRVVAWLRGEPHRTAKELFDRLRQDGEGRFADGQLRTLQRRVKEWRRVAARRLVCATAPERAGGGPLGAGPVA